MDNDERQHFEELLRQYQRRLRLLETREAQMGMNTPPEVLSEIDDIRSKIARIKAQLNGQSDVSASEPTNLRQIRTEAEIAYHTEEWEQAETLLSQWIAAEPYAEDAQQMLKEVQQELDLKNLYTIVCTLRDAEKWSGVLKVLDRLKLHRDPYKDSQKIRAWAETRQHLDPAIVLLRSKNFSKALDQLEQLLQHPDERAALLTASLIERAEVPLEQRARAARMVDAAGDPRPGLQLEQPDYWAQRIDPGPFLMGDDNSSESDEKPAFVYHIRQPYALARYPVTNSQYARFLADLERQGKGEEGQRRRPYDWQNNRAPDGMGNHPVVYVSWEDATAFAAWADQTLRASGMLSSGELIRLPTEPEWERAAAYPVVFPHPPAPSPSLGEGEQQSSRGEGIGRREYPWGAWLTNEVVANTDESGIGGISAVGLFPQGAAGCGALDMAGNIWEWCSTPYLSYKEIARRGQVEATTLDNYKSERSYVLRGGSWDHGQQNACCAYRDNADPGSSLDRYGFRLARCSPRL